MWIKFDEQKPPVKQDVLLVINNNEIDIGFIWYKEKNERIRHEKDGW